ncbi:MAG: glycosyltransferase [Flavobacteriales bacterium]|nr:glycosyltransferase [Flavobacteriales bacterium]
MKRVLIISYYWPPAGGISIIRPVKLAKYLRNTGWEPVICTAKDPHYPFEDDKAVLDVPKDVEIIKVPIVEPYEIYKKLTGQKQKSALADVIQNTPKRSFFHKLSVWIRGNFFIPDARCLWINPVVKELSAYLKKHPVDAIITTGPPHSVNRIGYLLKKKLNLPWLADFQDPWTQVDYYQHFKISSRAHKRHRKMEKQVFDHADLITIVSDSWKTDLQSIGAKNVEVVPLGFDPEDFNVNTKLDEQFTLTHLGLLGQDRNPSTLIKVIKSICDENEDFASKFKLQLVGKVNEGLQKEIADLNLSEQVIYKGQVSRDEALRIMQSSQLLLLLLNKAANVSGRIPGKVFEYLGAHRPILSLGPKGTDIETMLRESSAGAHVEYESETLLRSYILATFDKYKTVGLDKMERSLEMYSHGVIASKFTHLLEQINK